jgi:Na+/H+ antiporter NhaC
MSEDWVWPILIGAIFIIILIGLAFEIHALRHGKTTFSAYVYDKTKDNPSLIFISGLIVGLIIGTLAGHFWSYCP